jgi:SAM-dependent methyltransferase
MGYRYLLGDSRTEASRLQAQARLWDPTSHALFDRLGIRRLSKVLEIGPGQGSLHRELRRRVKGPVDAVERSQAFCRNLREQCARDGFGGRIFEMDLIDADLPRDHYDVIFARWVFLFLPDPLAHLRKLVRALKPGGLLALEEYHRETFVLVPRPSEWEAFRTADRLFFESQGGNASIGSALPDLYRRVGLEVKEILPAIKVGRPGSPVWNWVTTYFRGVIDRLAAFPPLDRKQARSLMRKWRAAEEDPSSLLIAPAVLDVVGRRPRRGRL